MPIDYASAHFFLNKIAELFKNWWWVILPLLFWRHFLFLYLWWRIDGFLSAKKMILLEVKLPKEIEKPMRAMEVVLSSIYAAVYHPPDFWEKWMDGQVQLSVALEMVSIGGETHFFIRMESQYRDAVESSFYAQYPEIEMTEAEDYTKKVPQNIPNKEWDLFGCDYRLAKDDHYPIKTYVDFETEREKEKEEVVEPMAALLEGMSKIKKGEQLWIQFLIEPVGDGDLEKSFSSWRKQGEELRDSLARRPGPPPPPGSIIKDALEFLITGKVPEQKKEEKDVIPPEMKLTPGEREVLMAIERKMSKPIFQTTIRFIFMGKLDVWFKPNFRLVFSYFSQYATNHLNALFPLGSTITKIKKSFFFPLINIRPIYNRRKYLRSRQLFRRYIKRDTTFFPRAPKPGERYMLNTEEMASLFHFPSQRSAPAPGFARIEVRKKSISPYLPTE